MSTSPSDPPLDPPGAEEPDRGIEGIEARFFDGVRSAARSVRLTIRDGRVLVAGDGVARDEPLEAVTISERMGSTPRFVRFSDGVFCEVTDQPRLATMLEQQGLDRQWLPAWEGHTGLVVGAIVLLLVVCVAGYRYGLPWMAESAASRVPMTALDPLSYRVLRTLDRLVLEPTALSREKQFEIMRGLARLRLPPDSRVSVQFRRSDAIGPNAFALPSGLVIVTDDLVRLAGSRDQVLAVLAHEAGHVERRHGLRQMIQSSMVSLFVTWYVGDVSALAAVAPTALLEARYSRDLEHEADAYAVQILRASGISPSELADILQAIEAETSTSSVSFSYLASHPPTSERLEALRRGDAPAR